MPFLKLKTKKPLSVGARGEMVAENYLKKIGYTVLARNFTNSSGRRLGEIDIIATDNAEIVFVEVKTRISNYDDQILPEENITKAKLYKLNKIASFYINKNKLFDVSYRFDAITIIANTKTSTAKIRHIKNIFI
ncbi:MAG: YraN family protein [bacterium]